MLELNDCSKISVLSYARTRRTDLIVLFPLMHKKLSTKHGMPTSSSSELHETQSVILSQTKPVLVCRLFP